jgi:hypothetical protein
MRVTGERKPLLVVIVLVTIVAMTQFWIFAVASTGTFGYATLGGSNIGVNKIQGSVFTAPAAGVATNLTVGVRSSYGSALGLTGAIYRHSDLSLVAVTEEVAVPARYTGWVTLPFTTPQPELAADTAYILMAFSETIGGNFLAVYYDPGAADQGHQLGFGIPYPAYPATISPAHTSRRYSLYCNYQDGIRQEVAVYRDAACTETLDAIDWGVLSPGSRVTRTLYVRSHIPGNVTLQLTTDNWSPDTASQYLAVEWPNQGIILAYNETVRLDVTLIVAADVHDITDFTVDVVVTAISSGP